MLKNPVTVYSIIAAAGLLVMILGFKLAPKTRKAIETAGALIFHIGVFGILYYKVSIFLFVSLAALVISLFILFDPLKIGTHLNTRLYRLIGYFFLVCAVVFSLAHFTGFPPSLWLIPLIIYLLPYLVPAFKKNLKTILAVAWLIIFLYIAVIGYIVYGKYYPVNQPLLDKILRKEEPKVEIEPDDVEDEPKPKLFTFPPNPTVKIVDPQSQMPAGQNGLTAPQPAPAPVIEDDESGLPPLNNNGPISKIIQAADEEVLKRDKELEQLKADHETLKHMYEELAAENKRLKEELKK